MTYINNKKPIGRPKIEYSKQMLEGLYLEFKSWRKVAAELGISYGTVYRRLNELNVSKSISYGKESSIKFS